MPVSPVNDSSIDEMIDSLENLKVSAFSNNEWLTSNNRYAYDIIKVYKADVSKPRTHHKFLKDYTASASILHCTDGWTFLSKAITSLVNGDIPSAIFFTYYSELRALMSLFATNGISILERQHVFINRQGKAVKFNGQGTHPQVRITLDEYVAHPTKTELLLEWLKVENKTLKDWIRATGSLASGYLTQDWLKKWSVDIGQIKFDHDARNQVSYRPHKLKSNLFDNSYKENLLKVISFWELCEPTTSNNFYLLDRHLLRISLEEIFNLLPYRGTSNGKRNKNSRTYKNSFKKFIIKASNNLGTALSPSLIKFLTREDCPEDSSIIIEANKPTYNKRTKTFNLLPMIARSLMLLRISTGGNEYLLKKARVDKDDLEFWWSDYGNKYGFWNWDVLPADFKEDLWPDIAEALTNLKSYCTLNNVQNAKKLENVGIEDLNRFTQINQIPLWGIGL